MTLHKKISLYFDCEGEIGEIMCRYGEAVSRCRRGKAGVNTFSLKKPIKALIYLLLTHRLNGHSALWGGRCSFAAALDRAIHQRHYDSPAIANIFACDSIFSFVTRKNAQFGRPSDQVRLEIKKDVSVHVYVNKVEVLSGEVLSRLCVKFGFVAALDNTVNGCKSAAPQAVESESLVQTWRWYDAISDGSISFTKDWLPIVGSVIENTHHILRATVFDFQIKSWWSTLPGRYYSALNVKLLSQGKEIRRMFVYDDANIESVLEEALVQAELGVDARVISYHDYAKLFDEWRMISVHDDHIGAVHCVSSGGYTALNTKGAQILELTETYDSLFSVSQVPVRLAGALNVDEHFKIRAETKTKALTATGSETLLKKAFQKNADRK